MAKSVATRPANAPSPTAATAAQASQRHILGQFMADLDRRMPIVRHLLPAQMRDQAGEQKFRAMILTAITNSKDGKLFECTPASLLRACAEAAQDGLSLSPQHKQADIIPRWNGKLKCLEAVYQPRYGGLMTLARRSGEIRNITAEVVREKDEFDYELGLKKTIHVHRPAKGDRGKLINSYCVWELKDGTKGFEVLDETDIARAKRASQSKDKDSGEFYGPWKDDEAEMWRKSAIRRASKYMPSSAEDFQRAVQREMMNDIGEPMAGDDVFDLPDDAGGAPAPETKQLDRLEEKVTAKPAAAAAPAASPAPSAAPKPSDFIRPAKVDGRLVYEPWVAEMAAAFDALPDDAARQAFTTRYAVMLEGAEIDAPDVADPILTRTSPFRGR